MQTGFRALTLALMMGGVALAQTDPAAPAPAPTSPVQGAPAEPAAPPTLAAAPSGPPASVYFENTAQSPTPVNVYVDGQLVYSGVFPASVTSFPHDLATGERRVVVTPAYAVPGQRDLLNTTVTIPSSGVYTLSLGADINDANTITGYTIGVESGYQDPSLKVD